MRLIKKASDQSLAARAPGTTIFLARTSGAVMWGAWECSTFRSAVSARVRWLGLSDFFILHPTWRDIVRQYENVVVFSCKLWGGEDTIMVMTFMRHRIWRDAAKRGSRRWAGFCSSGSHRGGEKVPLHLNKSFRLRIRLFSSSEMKLSSAE